MKKVFIIFFILLFFTAEITAQEIRFSPWPIGSRDQSIYDNKPLTEYLSKKLNMPVRIVYFEKYERIMEEFKNGNLDLITIGPNPYSQLRREYPHSLAIAIIKDESGNTKYTCSVVVRKNGPNSVKAIKGPLAMCQGLCTCGRFFANHVFRSIGKDLGKFTYKEYSFHNEVVEAVIRGDAEAGFLRTEVAKKYLGYNIKIIHTSPLLPNRVVVANKKTLSNEVIEKIRQTLLEISPSTHSHLGIYKNGFAEFNEETFKALNRLK